MTESQFPSPPVAPAIHTETSLHGVVLTDDYAWLRDKQNPAVTAYLEAENAYAEEFMAPLAPLRDELYQEMLSHVKQTDVSVPFLEGGWWYYTRTEEGRQYSIYCRKTGSAAEPAADAEEQILLDGNALSEGHAFFAIGATDVSDDGCWLAYTTDTTGFRQYTLHIKDLETGETLPDIVERVGSVVWAADNETIFYTVEDEEQKRQFQLYRAQRGKIPGAVLIYQDDDERFNIGTGRTRDGKFLVLESASHTTSESHVLPADHPNGAFQLICARQDEHEYSLDHRNGQWFIRTNDNGRNFRLVTAPTPAPDREHWTELIPHRDRCNARRRGPVRGLLRRLRTRRRFAALAHLAFLRRWRCKPPATARLPFPSRPTAPIRTSIASLRRPSFATRTSRWSLQVRCTNTTWRQAPRPS